jgi:hypothetical protein
VIRLRGARFGRRIGAQLRCAAATVGPPLRRVHGAELAPRAEADAPTRRALLAFRMSEISVHQVLETVGDFDSSGGASLGLVAWELSVEPRRAVRAWRQAQAERLIRAAGVDRASGEQLWRLTVRGWARLREDNQDC